jgi:uncharacterized NAD(P)/FAD-binding protein YdhS
LQAINLARHDGPVATLIERDDRPGCGLAYSAAPARHLLNVRAGNMSALPDQPDHFVRWLADRHACPSGFAPRLAHGDYLADLLDETARAMPGRVMLRRADVVDIAMHRAGMHIRLADGAVIDADTAVLAVGKLPPHAPPALADAALPACIYAADPWQADLTAGLPQDGTVLTIGTGLTMVDVAFLPDASGFKGKIIALSRRGLSPRRMRTLQHPTPSRPPNARPSTHPPCCARATRADDRLADQRG